MSGRNKRLGALVKSRRCDTSGVAPLRDREILCSDPKSKANILNRQFTSVFTQDNGAPVPELGPDCHPPIKSIVVDENGVIKLLKLLKPHTATCPDGIPVML